MGWGLPVALAVIYVAICLLMLGFQRSLMYFPQRPLPTLAEAGLPNAETIRFTTDDGLELTSWFVPLAGANYTVIVFHGNAGNISHRAFLADVWRAAGCSVLLLEYRGYGDNPGAPGEQGLYRDGRAALKALESRPDVDPTRIIYFGKSLGTGPATQLAVERTPAALVLDSPFTSMANVAQHHYWYLPAKWLTVDRYDNLSKIARVACPVLIIYADRDGIVPPSHSRRLHEAANDPKRLHVVKDAGHNDLVEADTAGYILALKGVVEMAEEGRQ